MGICRLLLLEEDELGVDESLDADGAGLHRRPQSEQHSTRLSKGTER